LGRIVLYLTNDGDISHCTHQHSPGLSRRRRVRQAAALLRARQGSAARGAKSAVARASASTASCGTYATTAAAKGFASTGSGEAIANSAGCSGCRWRDCSSVWKDLLWMRCDRLLPTPFVMLCLWFYKHTKDHQPLALAPYRFGRCAAVTRGRIPSQKVASLRPLRGCNVAPMEPIFSPYQLLGLYL
jgi:hypothetical protein